MPGVTLDVKQTTPSPVGSISVQSLSERQDENAIRKTIQAGQNIAPFGLLNTPTSTSSLADRQVKNETNYIIRIQTLIGKLLAQQTRLSDKERNKTEKLKADYQLHTGKSAELTRATGRHGIYYSAFGAILTAASLYAGKEDEVVGKLLDYLANNGWTSITQMFNSQVNADQRKVDALTQLLSAEYTAATSKGASDSNSKQELIGLLEKVLESIRSASRAG